MMTRLFVSAALAAAAALFSAAPAAAAAEADTFLVFIPFGDLDLTTEAGERALESRLEAAARQTCAAGSTLRERIAARACHVQFERAAQPKVEQAWARHEARQAVVLASR